MADSNASEKSRPSKGIDDVLARSGDGHAAPSRLGAESVALQKPGEDALDQSEKRYRQLIDALPSAIYTTDAQGRLTHFNSACIEFSGRTPELGSDHWCVTWKLFHPDGTPMPHDECPMAIALKQGRIVRGAEAIAERPDGSRIWFEPYPMPLFDDAGQLVGGINMLVDITERKQANETAAWLAAIVTSSEDAIVGKTLDGIINTWNKGAEQLFGYTADEAVGKSITMLIPRDHRDEEPQIIRRIRRGEAVEHYETVRQRKDGSLVHVSLAVSPVRDASGKIIGASKIARDITERKRAEVELRASETALKLADRRKDEFLATLAHELRNPLAPIRNGLEILRQIGMQSASTEPMLDMMSQQVDHIVRLVDDLLDVSRISRGKVELNRSEVELAPIVQQVVDANRPVYRFANRELMVSLPTRPIWLNADPTRLAQVLGNLLNNAAKYTRERGCVWLTVEREDSEAVIRVRDNGIGIAADQLERVFEIFAQADTSITRKHSGLGLGLSLVKELVELHGGRVEMRSEGLGQGSELVMRLPTISQPPEVEAVATVQRSVIGGQRILIVDDNGHSADTLATLFALEDNQVHTRYNGFDAVSAAAELKPDIILLDIGMPGLDGFEACRQIRTQVRSPQPVMIALTGWSQVKDRRRSEQAGFDAHAVKPIAPEALMELIASLLKAPRK